MIRVGRAMREAGAGLIAAPRPAVKLDGPAAASRSLIRLLPASHDQ
jgi:hypothetical protein